MILIKFERVGETETPPGAWPANLSHTHTSNVAGGEVVRERERDGGEGGER